MLTLARLRARHYNLSKVPLARGTHERRKGIFEMLVDPTGKVALISGRAGSSVERLSCH